MAQESRTPRAFCVVAIGASAGGLEALESFFPSVPGDTGLAFVVVQHLERSHPSMQGIAKSLSDQDMADLAAYYGASNEQALR